MRAAIVSRRSRAAKLGREIEERAQPARTHLNQVNYQLARQIASLSRETATGDEDREVERAPRRLNDVALTRRLVMVAWLTS